MEKFVDALKIVYEDKAEEIAKKLDIQLDKIISQTTGTPDKDWYRSVEIYCVYPDGVIHDKALSPLQNINIHLKKIKSLGVSAIHILPFLESPLIDRGFDISNYLKINPKFGSLEDMQEVIDTARELDIHVFMDLVFNHASDQHEWFQKAINGDAYYRNFFLHTDKKPKFLRKFHKDSAVWAEYEVNGKVETVNIAFPEYAGPIPHWQEQKDGYWYYHTYYPSQIDLNWCNPDLFVEMAKVVLYWAKFGFNFRLDAIPFVGKGPYKQVNVINKEAHAITAALKCIADVVNPNCAFLVETYEEIASVIEYFGNDKSISANLSYNFHLCTSIWVSLVTQNVNPIWDKLIKLKPIPKHAEWLNFLRNHDELSLAYLSDETLTMMQKELIEYGADFREGCGISGRTFSLLKENLEHFLMAYFLLASLPGGLMIPYGDELAKPNIPVKNLPKADQKDTRNINRGLIDAKEYDEPKNAKIFSTISSIISQRRIFRLYLNNWPTRIIAPDNIFAAAYSDGPSNLFIFINLSDQTIEVPLDNAELQIISHVNKANINKNKLTLGAFGGAWLKLSS